MVDCGRRTGAIVRCLREHKVFIQPGSSWGLTTYIGVSVGTTADNQTFLETLREVSVPA